MDKKLSMKKSDGKWWTYGNLKTNQWGNEQVSFKLSNLEELVAEAKKMGKEWVNLSLFDNDRGSNGATLPPKQPSPHDTQKANAFAPAEKKMIDDDIPFS